MDRPYDLGVIGAGIAGYSAARAAVKKGARVALVDGDDVGGTCLNRGCIPTKAWLDAAELLHGIRAASSFGVQADIGGIDLSAAAGRARSIVTALTQGMKATLAEEGVDLLSGRGSIAGRAGEGWAI